MIHSFFIVNMMGLFFSLITYAGFVRDQFGINFYERFGLIPKFCKVEFVCLNGEPNWLGELFLFAPFLFIVMLIIYGLYVIDVYRGGGWFFHR